MENFVKEDMIQDLNRMVEESNEEIKLEICIKGVVLSGSLISYRLFLTKIGQKFSESSKKIVNMVSNTKKEQRTKDPYNFIYLSDAKIINLSGQRMNSSLFQIRTDSIDSVSIQS
jgi:hypothetical protein